MSDWIELEGERIKLGEKKRLSLKVSRLPSGHEIEVFAHIIRGNEPGPCILLLAGVHGDEINGVEILRRAVAEGHLEGLKKGTIIAIPIVNVYGFINFSRDMQDGKDVNRSFPGNFKGSMAARVARTITKKVMPLVDIVLDFHTGGASRYNYPQIRYTTNDESSLELAKVFGCPYTIIKDPINRSLRQFAFKENKPCLVFEGGESKRFDLLSIQEALKGMKRVLVHLDMIDGELVEKDCLIFSKSSWIRAHVSGIFLWKKESGDLVQMNEVIGEINEPYGLKKSEVKANRDGFIIGHNNGPIVMQGEALFHIAYQWEKYSSGKK